MQRIHIDSRSRSSGSNESFEFAIPYTINIPEESMMVVDTVAIPNSFHTVTTDYNDRFYYTEFGINSDNETVQQWTIKQLPPGYYDVNSYAKALESALNLNRLAIDAYTVSFNSLSGSFQIRNNFVGTQDYMSVFTRELLLDPTKNQKFNFNADYSNLMDNCRELGMVDSRGNKFSVAGGFDQDKILTMLTAPVLQPHVNLFVKSPKYRYARNESRPWGFYDDSQAGGYASSQSWNRAR